MEWFPSKILYQTEFTNKVVNDEMPVYPHMIELSPTDRCNLNCYWCVEKAVGTLSKGDWDIKILKQRMTEFAAHGTKAVTIEGGGEPTLYPHLEELVDHISSLGMEMGLITNGVIPVNDNIISKVKWIRLSLDAATAESYKKIKGLDVFKKVMDNARTYGEKCADKGVVFGIAYVITPLSLEGLRELIEEVKGYKGVRYVQLKSVTETDDYLPVNEETFGWAKALATSNMDVYTVDCYAGNEGVGCIASPITSTIMNNGDVLFCKRLRANRKFNGDYTVIGNIRDNTVEEVYNSEKRKAIAEMVKSKDFCVKECPGCRISKYNYVLWTMRENKSLTYNFV